MTPISNRPEVDGAERRTRARQRRQAMLERSLDAAHKPILVVEANTDNALSQRPMAFAKGLYHDADGRVEPADIDSLRDALSGDAASPAEVDPAFDVPLVTGPVNTWTSRFKNPDPAADPYRKYESPLTGLYYDTQGADVAGVAMTAAPALGSSELAAEMAEVYAMAVVRDMTFEELGDPTKNLYRVDPTKADTTVGFSMPDGSPATVQDLLDALNSLSWLSKDAAENPPSPEDEPYAENRRQGRQGITAQSLFRGSTAGALHGPYVSQFMLVGSAGVPEDGQIAFGANLIDQKVTSHKRGLDYMTSFTEWRDVQMGVNLAETDVNEDDPAFVQRPRDLASYVHVDQLYQAYFNACLLMLGNKIKPDAGFPESDHANRTGFVSFGGPHVLSLMTEVASRALRAVRRQKFQVHLRGRPERLAALVTLMANGRTAAIGADAEPLIAALLGELGLTPATQTRPIANLMHWVDALNTAQNDKKVVAKRRYEAIAGVAGDTEPAGGKNYLLPMAFPEGSPMHASYGAGHATVAGACVTMLKAFFQLHDESGTPIGVDVITGTTTPFVGDGANLKASADGVQPLSIEGELDKLAANISIGRNMAGVHYYSDYFDSLRMGERIAVGLLEEQMIAYPESVNLRFTSFDGEKVELGTSGHADPIAVMLTVDGSAQTAAEWWVKHVRNSAPKDPLPVTPVQVVSNWTVPA